MKESLSGFVNIHKPPGITSHDVVNILRRKFATKHVGHAGTLDPLAEGVLPMAVGTACRLIRFLPSRKIYIASFLLGVQTFTDDITGDVMFERPFDQITSEMVEAELAKFVGVIDQVPPRYSAISVGGKRLYTLARAGIEVEVKARQIEIYRLDVVRCDLPAVLVRIECASGTYIRSIARDLGEALGCGGCMTALIRERSGAFRASEANKVEIVQSPSVFARDLLLDPLSVLRDDGAYPVRELDSEKALHVVQGKPLICADLDVAAGSEQFVLLSYHGKLLAVSKAVDEKLKSEVVIADVFELDAPPNKDSVHDG